MKIAIAGTGDVSSYLIEALSTLNHDIIVLTRSTNPNPPLPVPHRTTDYTVPSLLTALSDRQALISTVSSYDNPEIVTPVHLALLSAVEQSDSCKLFIPSEWTSDGLNYPDQPMFMRAHQDVLRGALREASKRDREGKLQWTIICNSWFMDYGVPAQNRRLRDVGPMWPMDWEKREFTIYGHGEQRTSFVTVRDVAVAVGRVLDVAERGGRWEEFIFVEGDRVTWNEMFELVNERRLGGGEWTKRVKPLSETVENLVAAEKEGGDGVDAYKLLEAQFEILSYSGASLLPRELVEECRRKYFGGLKFRMVREVLDLVEGDPDVVV